MPNYDVNIMPHNLHRLNRQKKSHKEMSRNQEEMECKMVEEIDDVVLLQNNANFETQSGWDSNLIAEYQQKYNDEPYKQKYNADPCEQKYRKERTEFKTVVRKFEGLKPSRFKKPHDNYRNKEKRNLIADGLMDLMNDDKELCPSSKSILFNNSS